MKAREAGETTSEITYDNAAQHELSLDNPSKMPPR
jgi:hypothetical protein